MNTPSTHMNVLTVFARYGFRKSSMEDLAKAADVSRQTLYNRFRSKEAVLDWAVEGVAVDLRNRAFAALDDRTLPVDACLTEAFSRWIGDLVPLLHSSPHASEIMDMGSESLRQAGIDMHAEVEKVVTQTLLDRGVYATAGEAAEMTFVLLVASKGLMLKSQTLDEFETGMARVVGTVLQRTHSGTR